MTIRSILFIVAAGVVAACGSDGPGTGPVTAADAEDGCRRGCEHEEACEPGGESVAECTTDCVAQVTGVIRADVFEVIVDCTTVLACDARDDECIELCSPTSTHETFEAQCREVFGVCDTDIDRVCETTPSGNGDGADTGFYCLLTPAIMNEMIACIPDGTACQAGFTCIDGVLEDHGIGSN